MTSCEVFMPGGHEIYSDLEIATDVMSANSYQLIKMLLDRAMQKIQIAKQGIIMKDLGRKRQAIGKAKDIIDYLRLCLNMNDSKTHNLAALIDENYRLIEICLFNATIKNDVKHLDHALAILGQIKEGWDGIANK